MTKSMGMNYSVNWWKNNNMAVPPEINPCEFLIKKIDWRYAKGLPKVCDSKVLYWDSAVQLVDIVKRSVENNIKFSLLFTSPPYCAVTNYHVDQWLRLWMLGGADSPKAIQDKHKGRFVNKQEYYQLLDNVFGLCSKMMAKESTIYVRTDKREFTFNTTLEILQKCFPKHKVQIFDKPLTEFSKTQTKLFGDKSMKPGEVDVIITNY